MEGRRSSQRDVQALPGLGFDSRDSTLLCRAAPEVVAKVSAERASEVCGRQEPVENAHVHFLTEP